MHVICTLKANAIAVPIDVAECVVQTMITPAASKCTPQTRNCFQSILCVSRAMALLMFVYFQDQLHNHYIMATPLQLPNQWQQQLNIGLLFSGLNGTENYSRT